MNILGHARVYTGPRVIRRPSSGVAVGKDSVQLPSFKDEKLYVSSFQYFGDLTFDIFYLWIHQY